MVINEQSWSGSTANTYVAKYVLEKRLGCKVKLTQVTEGPPYFQAMRDGKVDVALEDWDPVSLYAATKRADELMSDGYAHLYRHAADGVALLHRLWPVGPARHGLGCSPRRSSRRADPVFNHGEMKRDFTYIDDIVTGVVAALDHPPTRQRGRRTGSTTSAITAPSRCRVLSS